MTKRIALGSVWIPRHEEHPVRIREVYVDQLVVDIPNLDLVSLELINPQVGAGNLLLAAHETV